MCASPQSNWLNIIAVRGDFLGENQEKPWGGGGLIYLPLEKPRQKLLLLFEFWSKPFKLAKFH